jgi:GNAT superfamily N-acetyltransferase
MAVEQIDPRDDEVFDDWYEMGRLTHEDAWPGRPGWQRSELLAAALDQQGPIRTVDFVLRDDGGVVRAAASVELPRRDNLEKAFVDISVPPENRRKGLGSKLLLEIELFVRGEGRTVVANYVQTEPLALTGCSTGRYFAEHHGFSVAQVNARRELILPLSADVEQRIEIEEKRAKQDGYDLTAWTGRWPNEFVKDRIEFGRRMSTDVPMGETGLEEEVWDEERVRAGEARVVAENRMMIVTVAQERSTGRLVAFTEIAVPLGVPEFAYQHDTLVLAEHRGHGLGLAVKLYNLRAVERHSPRTTHISTWNATDNPWMIAVNEDLGCELIAHSNYWTKTLQ